MALTFLGNVIAILLGELIMNVLGLNWSIYLTIFCFLFFLSGFLCWKYIEEVEIEFEEVENVCEDMK